MTHISDRSVLSVIVCDTCYSSPYSHCPPRVRDQKRGLCPKVRAARETPDQSPERSRIPQTPFRNAIALSISDMVREYNMYCFLDQLGRISRSLLVVRIRTVGYLRTLAILL
jgi:hypothetical protein